MSVKSLEIMLRLSNKIWFTEKIPSSWLHSIIVLIPKTHKPLQMLSSYRPISLTSNVCKLFEKMVVCRFKWFLDYYNILTLTQTGFRQRRKTTHHLLRLHEIIHKSLANKHNVLPVFVDVEKAYGMVNKTVIYLKLLISGITGRMFQFFRSFISNRTFQVRVGPTLSMTKLLESGTIQGSVLSPVFFSLMINDLPNTITSPSALYANAFCFWEHGSGITLLNQLCQRSLTRVCKWCDDNGFEARERLKQAITDLGLDFETTHIL